MVEFLVGCVAGNLASKYIKDEDDTSNNTNTPNFELTIEELKLLKSKYGLVELHDTGHIETKVYIDSFKSKIVNHSQSEVIGYINDAPVYISLVKGSIDFCYEDGRTLNKAEETLITSINNNPTRFNAVNAVRGKPITREEYPVGCKVKSGTVEIIVFYEAERLDITNDVIITKEVKYA